MLQVLTLPSKAHQADTSLNREEEKKRRREEEKRREEKRKNPTVLSVEDWQLRSVS